MSDEYVDYFVRINGFCRRCDEDNPLEPGPEPHPDWRIEYDAQLARPAGNCARCTRFSDRLFLAEHSSAQEFCARHRKTLRKGNTNV